MKKEKKMKASDIVKRLYDAVGCPSKKDMDAYNRVSEYYARRDLLHRLMSRAQDVEEKLANDSITPENVAYIADMAELQRYDDFDDAMAEAYWSAIDSRIDVAIMMSEGHV